MSTPALLKIFDVMARERSGGMVSLQLAWSAALNKLSSAKILDVNAELIAQGCRAPRDVELITTMIGSGSGADELLSKIADESAYSLEDILNGLIALCRFLDRDRRQTSMKVAVGYIRCCEDSVDSYSGLTTLAEVVEQMLEEHGFEG